MSDVVHVENVNLDELSKAENLKDLTVVGLTKTGNHRFEVTHNGECFSVDFFNLKEMGNNQDYNVSALSSGTFLETISAAKDFEECPENVREE